MNRGAREENEESMSMAQSCRETQMLEALARIEMLLTILVNRSGDGTQFIMPAVTVSR